MVNPLEEYFPALAKGDYQLTSPKDPIYNCIGQSEKRENGGGLVQILRKNTGRMAFRVKCPCRLFDSSWLPSATLSAKTAGWNRARRRLLCLRIPKENPHMPPASFPMAAGRANWENWTISNITFMTSKDKFMVP